MDRISEIFKSKKPLILFATAGFPTIAESEAALELAIAAGADILELGVPFSDPMADGPVIADASRKLAEQGVSLADVLGMIERLRTRHPETGIILFSYMNPILHYGYDALCADLARIGADGILPVDLPLEERNELLIPCRKHGLHMIPLVSPLTPPGRVSSITTGMTGFVYYINVAGVTGARAALPRNYPDLIEAVRLRTSLPVASGFGIADAATAEAAARHADGVICGSGYMKALGTGGAEAAAKLVRELKQGILAAGK